MADINNSLPEDRNNAPLSPEEIEKTVRARQNFPLAIIGGSLAALLSALLWAVITVLTKYQIGYMAIAVGLIVGLAVRFFGVGIDKKFGILGAVLALLGCLAGNFFSQIGFIANEYSYGYLETLFYFDLASIKNTLFESFSPIDILFYGIAMYEGYHFSVYKDIESSFNAWNRPTPKCRKRLAFLSSGALAGIALFLTQDHIIAKTNTYESGAIMSEGNIKNGKYDGRWTFYYENGKKLSEGSFFKDLRDGDWQWYNENGVLEKTGSYQKGLECGVWKNYYESGQPYDSINYQNGRISGAYASWYENGNIYQKGSYHLDKQNGLWETYYENGQLWSKGEMKNDARTGNWITYSTDGSPAEEIHYEGEILTLKNCWDIQGKQTVKDGNGFYAVYHEDGKTLLSGGEVKDGKRTGLWKSCFPTGKTDEEGLYENDLYKLLNAWDYKGRQTVKDGNGTYVSYWDNDSVYTTGDIKNGLKEGVWHIYNHEGILLNETAYLNNKSHGKTRGYYHPDQISFEGEFSNGLLQGDWIWYNEDGSISSSVQCENDKKVGSQLFYDPYGHLIKEEIYKDGELIETKLLN